MGLIVSSLTGIGLTGSRMAAAFILGSVALASSALAQVTDPHLAGNVRTDIWLFENVNRFGDFGTAGDPWDAPILSTESGGVDAEVNKVAGSGFATGSTLYAPGFSYIPNTYRATFSITEPDALDQLKTVVFQIDIGEVYGHDLYNENHVGPVLNINGGSQLVAPDTWQLRSHIDTGEKFPIPTGGEEPVYRNTWLGRWDLSGVDPVSSFEIQWDVVEHTQTYVLRLDQSDAIPEPSMLGLLSLGALTLVRRKRR